MNKKLNTAAKLVALAGAFALTGCAFLPATVNPTYVPQANVQKIPGADKVTVDVIIKNEKKHKNEVSYKRDGFEIKMAGVYMNVAKVFRSSIDEALYKMGFNLGLGTTESKKVIVIVKKFYLPTYNGLFEDHFDGSMNMQVVVKSTSGNIIYTRDIVVNNIKSGYVIGGAGNAAQRLLSKGVNKLISDSTFIHALLDSAS
ncbi:hypothetical protein JKG47_16995 [Acidithiobacillus sp. MC6.1]|nr:hypothetical protein [Acidithiobacillus sp. MC6.1]